MQRFFLRFPIAALAALTWLAATPADAQPSAEALKVQAQRMKVVRQVAPAVCAIFKGGGGGSGVLIHPDGWALSNWHVTGYSAKVKVGLPDHQLYDADVVGLDPTGDIALIKLHPKVKGKPFPYAPLGDSDALAPGEWVLAMGNPFLLATDFTPTVTLGVVSGTKRFLPGQGFNLVYADAISLDAPINPGNSGGPLFNLAGEVVGINGRISLRDRGRVNIGAGYAISAKAIKNLMGVMRSGEIVERSTLDATVRTEEDGRIVVNQMFGDGPAALAGIQLGDELLEFDGQPITTENVFLNRIWTLIHGWVVKAKVRREDKIIEVYVRLGRIPQRSKKRKGTWKEGGDAHRRKQAAIIADASARFRGAGDLVASGTSAGDSWTATYAKHEAKSLAVGKDKYVFAAGNVTRNGKELTDAQAQEARLLWSLYAHPGDLLAGPQLAKGEVIDSGRLGLTATIKVRYDGMDDEYFIFHHDVSTERLLAVERWSKLAKPKPTRKDAEGEEIPPAAHPHYDEKGKYGLDFRVRYHDYRSFGGRQLATRRVLQRPGKKDQAIALASLKTGDTPVAAEAIAADAVRTRPPSALAHALQRTRKAIVKIYGAGHIKGIPAYGTGVIVSPKGRVLTYNSAMLTTPNLYVVLDDGSRRSAKLVHRAHDRDCAIIQIEHGKDDLPYLTPHTSDPNVGQWVVSVGNAFNLAQGAEPLALNLGILSARTRLLARRGLADFPYKGEVYVVDAQINPGSYGGPLLDASGNWIGLSGKVLDSKETNTQFHYALPLGAIGDLIAGKPKKTGRDTNKKKQKVFTGLIFLDAGQFRSPPPFVDRIFPLSAADAAGFKKDDLVLRVAGTRIRSIEDFNKAIDAHDVGDTVKLSVKRGSKVVTLELELEADEDDEEAVEVKPIKKPTNPAEWRGEFARRIREADSPYAKRSAARQLARMGGGEVVDVLSGLLRVADDEIRRAALVGLAECGPKAAPALDALRKIVSRGRTEELREPALRVLAAMGDAALPALGEVLEMLSSAGFEERRAAVDALAAMGTYAVPRIAGGLGGANHFTLMAAIKKMGAPAVDPLTKLLAGDAATQAGAAAGLGAVGKPAKSAVTTLIALLDAKSADVREAAAEALGAIGDARAAAPLVKALDAKDAKTKRAAALALDKLGPVARASLDGLVARVVDGKDKPTQRARLLGTIAAIGGVSGSGRLADEKPAADEAVRKAMARAAEAALKDITLVRRGELSNVLVAAGKDGFALLATQLVSPEVDRQLLAVSVALRLGKPSLGLSDGLVAATRTRDEEVRAIALEALTRAYDKAKVPAKVAAAARAALRDPVSMVRWSALRACANLKIADKDALERITKLATRSISETTRALALRALAELGAGGSKEYALYAKALEHYDARVRSAGLYGLARLKKVDKQVWKQALDALLAGFADEDEVKAEALLGLAHLKERAIPALSKALASGELTARYLSAAALEEMGPAAAPALPAMIKALRDPRFEVRERVAMAIGKLDKKQLSAKDAEAARKALIEALADERIEVATAATRALTALTGKQYALHDEWTSDRAWSPDDTRSGK